MTFGKRKRISATIPLILACSGALAGTDLAGEVAKVWVHPNGNFYFRLNNTSADAFCADQWFGFNLYVPASDQNFAYYYGVLVTSLTKNKSVRVANINVFNGTTACDITQTGYGVVLQQ